MLDPKVRVEFSLREQEGITAFGWGLSRNRDASKYMGSCALLHPRI